MAVAENWEDFLDEIEEPTPPPAPKPATTPAKPKAAVKSFADEDEPLNDTMAERMRRQKLVEESEKRALHDLFAGCERPEAPANPSKELEQRALLAAKAAKALAATSSDPLDSVQLKTFRDCERLVDSLSKKIVESPAKSPAWLRLLDLLLKECTPKMDLKDLKTLQGKLNSTVTEKEKAERQLAEKKKKPNDIGSQCRNYKDELDVVYGGDSDDEDEEYDEEDEFI